MNAQAPKGPGIKYRLLADHTYMLYSGAACLLMLSSLLLLAPLLLLPQQQITSLFRRTSPCYATCDRLQCLVRMCQLCQHACLTLPQTYLDQAL
jgi:hypothetical protein